MKIKGIDESALREAVRTASADLYDSNIVFKREPEWVGNYLHFTLTVIKASEPGGRRSHSGRRVAAACWHAHRDVMREIFLRAPDALLVTALARYEGAQCFEDSFEATGDRNIGSQARVEQLKCSGFMPLSMREACDC